jgi:Predicted membrane protein
MSDMSPNDQPRLGANHPSESKVAALATWSLYILSIPSANVLVLVGLVVAYAVRSDARGLSRQHVEAQIHLFWSVFWWTVLCWIAIVLSAVLSVVLVGIPFLLLSLLVWFLISCWFTVKSILGLIHLLNNQAP